MNGLGNLQDSALLDDPYPTYRRLLAQGPTVWDETHQLWLVLGHAEVLEAFRQAGHLRADGDRADPSGARA